MNPNKTPVIWLVVPKLLAKFCLKLLRNDFWFRKNVDKLIRELLLEDMVSHTVVKSLLSRYSYLHADPDACILSLAEIISDIREPISAVESQMSKEDQETDRIEG